jgi:hypothetical protein
MLCALVLGAAHAGLHKSAFDDQHFGDQASNSCPLATLSATFAAVAIAPPRPLPQPAYRADGTDQVAGPTITRCWRSRAPPAV